MEAFVCSNNVIALSRELLIKLSDNELKGVLAHELGHLMDKDKPVKTHRLAPHIILRSNLPLFVSRLADVPIGATL